MNTKNHITDKPKLMGEFFSLLGEMLNSGIPEAIKEARRYMSYDTPALECCILDMRSKVENYIRPELKRKKEIKELMKTLDLTIVNTHCPDASS